MYKYTRTRIWRLPEIGDPIFGSLFEGSHHFESILDAPDFGNLTCVICIYIYTHLHTSRGCSTLFCEAAGRFSIAPSAGLAGWRDDALVLLFALRLYHRGGSDECFGM